MAYTKITVTLVVESDDAEAVIQYLDDSLDKMDARFVTFAEEITQEEAPAPENADEIKGS